ncbi:MAG: DUF4136 domain-containing protein [Desulfobacterales bacterium]|jgi:hypothetical protein
MLNRTLMRVGILTLTLLSAAVFASCGAAPQIYSRASHESISLKPGDLEAHGLAFITPSTVTGQEEEKQAVAFTFAHVLEKERPGIRCRTLSETLSAINHAGFAEEYRGMFNDYRNTGLFDRDILKKVSEVTGARYLAQLKLQGFNQGSMNRLGVLGLRIMMTKYATLRLFFQIWDADEGTIVWEGIQEMNYSVEAIDERTVTLQTVIEKAAEELVGRLPPPPA